MEALFYWNVRVFDMEVLAFVSKNAVCVFVCVCVCVLCIFCTIKTLQLLILVSCSLR